MKRHTWLWGCLFIGVFLLVALAAGGWLFYESQFPRGGGPASSAVQVLLLSPSNGDEVNAGDYVQIAVRAHGPGPISSSEVLVDGQSLGAQSQSPEAASWTWRAWPLGVHTIIARASSANGETGQSAALILNVLAGSGAMQVPAAAGQTLAQIGQQFGVPPDQMGGANPHVDPNKPLADGQPIQVPTGGGSSGSGAGGGSGGSPGGTGSPGGGFFPWKIIWHLNLKGKADKSYCYTSDGSGVWDKMPKNPFEFFPGVDNIYTQLLDSFPTQNFVVQVQCWGWSGGALQFLGDGQAGFDPKKGSAQLVIDGPAFHLTGEPQLPPGGIPQADFVLPEVAAPYGLREPKDTADCLAHKGNLVICNDTLNAPLKTYLVVEWEWQPGFNWPGQQPYANNILGYNLYLTDATNSNPTFIVKVNPAEAHVGAIPLPWAGQCVGVQAYADGQPYSGTPGELVSKVVTYCPGQPPSTLHEFTVAPTDWLTFGGTWMDVYDCSDYGGAEYPIANYNNTGFGGKLGQVTVGSYIVKDDENCYREGSYGAAIRFGQIGLLPGAVVQKATFNFSAGTVEYGATGMAIGYKPASCAANVGLAKQDWTGLAGTNHFTGKNVASDPLTSISPFISASVDVTSAASDWLAHPENNHGLVLGPTDAPVPNEDGSGKCFSQLTSESLVIDYFAP